MDAQNAVDQPALGVTDRSATHLRAIQAVTEADLARLSLDGLLRALLDRIRDLLSVDTVAILLLVEAEGVLVARAASGLEEEVERGVRIPLGKGFAGRIASERRAIVLEDVRHADVLNPILLEKGIVSLLGVPLIVEGAVIGVLHVGSLTGRRFTAAETELLQIVADRAALGIDRARQLEAARVARADADVAEGAVRLRDEFIAIAAHELRTPLTGLKAAAQLLLRRSARSPLEPEQQRLVEMIEQQAGKMSRLVTHLLDTVRIQTDKLILETEATDLVLLTRRVVDEMSTVRGRSIHLSAPAAIRAAVDPLRVEQVFTNVLDNAVKYSPADSSIEVEVTRVAGAAVRIAIRDHGLGVPPERRAHIFERFYQAHDDRSGIGLGLYICRMIVEGHGGTMYAEFPDDGGTRIVIVLPLGQETQLTDALGTRKDGEDARRD
jgi:signal transduction histidine kinase